MKTAIQELIEHYEQLLRFEKKENKGLYMSEQAIVDTINMLKEALAKEKAQIFEAFNEGYRNGEIDFPSNTSDKDVACFDNAENYYTDTFTQIEPNF